MKHNSKLFRFLINLPVIGVTSICSPVVFGYPPLDPFSVPLQQELFDNNSNSTSNYNYQDEASLQANDYSKPLINDLKLVKNTLSNINHYSQTIDLNKQPDALCNLKEARGLIKEISDIINSMIGSDSED